MKGKGIEKYNKVQISASLQGESTHSNIDIYQHEQLSILFQKIATSVGLPLDSAYFTHNGIFLDKLRSGGEYNIQQNSNIICHSKIQGGMQRFTGPPFPISNPLNNHLKSWRRPDGPKLL